ncbi:MAG: hypothetical protein WC870_00295 [Candidatus Paceibacterota bacterium]
MSKKNIVIVGVLVLIIVILGVLQFKAKRADFYSVVYLTTGEVYVGKLTTFPIFQLKDSYILQVTKDATDPTKNNFQLQPISEALWAPESLRLERDNVVFYGPLLASSKIAETLAAQNK